MSPEKHPIPADSGATLGGLVLPVEPRTGDVAIRALRGWHWRVGTTQRLIVQGDAKVEIAGWAFEGSRLFFWIDRIPSKDGLVTQVALWIPDASASDAAVGRGPSGRNLLVVASVRGETVFDTALMSPGPPRELSQWISRADDRLAAYVADIQSTPPILADVPTIVGREAPDPGFIPKPGGRLPEAVAGPQIAGGLDDRWLHRPGARVSFSADHVTMDAGDIESTVLIDGNVVVHYKPASQGDDLGALRMVAERAVIYTSPMNNAT